MEQLNWNWRKFDFKKGSVGLARSLKYNAEDSQFFIILEDEPLFEGEFAQWKGCLWY